MVLRFVVALVLGAILGIERELVGKEAGVRTDMLVAGGAAIFAMIGLSLPYIAASLSHSTVDILSQTNSFGIIASIVTGIGFLGAGLIIKTGDHPHGITTAALVWMTAAIGVLAGLGIFGFAVTATILTAVLLYVIRKLDIPIRLERQSGKPPIK